MLAQQNLVETSFNKRKKIISVSKHTADFVDISDEWQNAKKTDITAIDLFCGCGGISKGLGEAGIDVLLGVDFFKEAGETYSHNFDHEFLFGDLTKDEVKANLYNKVKQKLNGKQLNIIAGGFPCQGFSMSGKRDLNDPRNRLYLDMLDIVNTLQPEFILMENVKGLRSMDGGKVEQRILNDFKNIGYDVNIEVLNAADFEVSQKRERVIFVGNRIGRNNFHPKPIIQNGAYKTTKDAIEDLMKCKENIDFNHVATKHNSDMQQRLMEVSEGKGLYANYSDSWKKCPWNEPSCTIKENHGGVNIHPKLPRVLTVRECARIQSFDDKFIFKGTKSKQLKQIGNAVPPKLAKAVGLAIIKSYEEKK